VALLPELPRWPASDYEKAPRSGPGAIVRSTDEKSPERGTAASIRLRALRWGLTARLWMLALAFAIALLLHLAGFGPPQQVVAP